MGNAHSGEVVEEEGGRMESDLERIWWPRDSPVHNPCRFVRSHGSVPICPKMKTDSILMGLPPSSPDEFWPSLRRHPLCFVSHQPSAPLSRGPCISIEISLTPVTRTAELGSKVSDKHSVKRWRPALPHICFSPGNHPTPYSRTHCYRRRVNAVRIWCRRSTT